MELKKCLRTTTRYNVSEKLKKPTDNIICHVPNELAQVRCPFLKDEILTSMTCEIT